MKKGKPLSIFFEEHQCSDDEKKAVWEYLLAIRLIPHIEKIRELVFCLFNSLMNH
jgi:hypothetical protein